MWQVQEEPEQFDKPITKFNKIIAVADSDFASRVDNSRSTSGYYIQFGTTGMIFAVSQMQKVVSISTTHSELICACECAKTVEWIRGFFKETQLTPSKPTTIKQDNQPAIELSHNAVYHFRTRHFRILQHYLRGLVENKIIVLEYQNTKEMNADFLNKTQPPARHLEIRMRCMNN